MRVVVRVGGQSFASSAEVGVMAHGALVTRSNNVTRRSLVLAKRTIAVNATVHFQRKTRLSEGTVDRCKPMTRMGEMRSRNAIRAIVPVRAAQAFVTYAHDMLYHVSLVFNEEVRELSFIGKLWGKLTLSQPSQTAACCWLRPG